MDFNVFDVIVISITLILAIKGFINGIIKELAGIAGIIGGIFLGSMFYAKAGEYINASIMKIPNESAINVVGFVAVFMLTWVIAVLIGMMLSKILKVAQLGILDKIGGVIFSAGKFFLIVSVIVTMLSQIEALQSSLEKYQKNSLMWPIMNKVGQYLIHIKPEDIQKNVDELKQKVNTNIGEKLQKTIEENKDKIVKTIKDNVKPAIEAAKKGE
jgi:membrane protein required for colicin V production